METLTVAVPPGAVEGTTLQVPGPGGQTVQVQVPPGVKPGSTFQASVAAAPAEVEAQVLAVLGFEQFAPVGVPKKYEILGDDSQILTVKLDDGETLIAETGSMNFMHPSVESDVDCHDCCGRMCSGEKCIFATFTGKGSDSYVALTPNIPSKVIPVPLSEVGGKIRAKNGAFFGSIGGATVSFDFDCNPVTCCFSGQGCVHQSVIGTGTGFLSAMGTILQKDLADGEKIVLDTDSLVAWSESAEIGIKTAGGCLACCCAGEGFFNTTVSGPGRIFVQSMSEQKFKAALRVQAAGRQQPRQGGGAPPTAERVER